MSNVLNLTNIDSSLYMSITNHFKKVVQIFRSNPVDDLDEHKWMENDENMLKEQRKISVRY